MNDRLLYFLVVALLALGFVVLGAVALAWGMTLWLPVGGRIAPLALPAGLIVGGSLLIVVSLGSTR